MLWSWPRGATGQTAIDVTGLESSHGQVRVEAGALRAHPRDGAQGELHGKQRPAVPHHRTRCTLLGLQGSLHDAVRLFQRPGHCQADGGAAESWLFDADGSYRQWQDRHVAGRRDVDGEDFSSRLTRLFG